MAELPYPTEVHGNTSLPKQINPEPHKTTIFSKFGLTLKQYKFCRAYVYETNGNGIKAAKIAGYKGQYSTLGQVAAENLKKPKIYLAIEALLKQRSKIATREDRFEFFSDVMFDESVPMKYRLQAAMILGKASGDFIERTENLNVNIDYSKLTTEQLERIRNGEKPELVIGS